MRFVTITLQKYKTLSQFCYSQLILDAKCISNKQLIGLVKNNYCQVTFQCCNSSRYCFKTSKTNHSICDAILNIHTCM